MGGGPPTSHKVPRVSWYFGSCLLPSAFAYGAFTSMAGFPKTILLTFRIRSAVRNPQVHAPGFRLLRFRSPLLRNRCFFLFLRLLRCFSSPGSLHTLWIGVWMAEVCSAGFPHSEIHGSRDICSSPWLFAAYHVFLRLSVPRHPPCALLRLTRLPCIGSVLRAGSGLLVNEIELVLNFNQYLMSFPMCSFQGTY